MPIITIGILRSLKYSKAGKQTSLSIEPANKKPKSHLFSIKDLDDFVNGSLRYFHPAFTEVSKYSNLWIFASGKASLTK